MSWKTILCAASLSALAFVTGPQHPTVISAAQAGCENGERIDGSTAADATHKLQGQGYSHVRELKKGCDNFWYGFATKDGREEHVSVSPSGEVVLQHE
jgi:hypothetical protein